MKYLKVFATAIFICIITIFISAPSKYMQSFFDGITIWAYNVLPAIFPFTVITTVTLKLQSENRYSFTKCLFNIDCDKILLSSIICGYPIGAKCIADSNADTNTSTKMCAFCSTAGPIFMIATVGAKLLQSTTATVIIIIVHICSAIINGLIFKTKKTSQISNVSLSDRKENLGDIVTNSALSIISVGGLIALFYMFTDMIKCLLPEYITDNLVFGFAIGLFEMTNGLFAICKLADITTATVLCSALLSFGGLCVFLQCFAFLSNKNVKPLDIIKMKLIQSSIATILSFILVKIFM